jgi:hypothetical protein
MKRLCLNTSGIFMEEKERDCLDWKNCKYEPICYFFSNNYLTVARSLYFASVKSTIASFEIGYALDFFPEINKQGMNLDETN